MADKENNLGADDRKRGFCSWWNNGDDELEEESNFMEGETAFRAWERKLRLGRKSK